MDGVTTLQLSSFHKYLLLLKLQYYWYTFPAQRQYHLLENMVTMATLPPAKTKPKLDEN